MFDSRTLESTGILLLGAGRPITGSSAMVRNGNDLDSVRYQSIYQAKREPMKEASSGGSSNIRPSFRALAHTVNGGIEFC
jgi:hypothetical protein